VNGGGARTFQGLKFVFNEIKRDNEGVFLDLAVKIKSEPG